MYGRKNTRRIFHYSFLNTSAISLPSFSVLLFLPKSCTLAVHMKILTAVRCFNHLPRTAASSLPHSSRQADLKPKPTEANVMISVCATLVMT